MTAGAASLEAVFRRERGRLVALLTRRFGLARLADAEDAVQGAMLAALRRWPHDGVPANPPAWLHRTAFRLLVDHLRHVAPLETGEGAEVEAIAESGDTPAVHFESEPGDDELALLFALCHPALPLESQLVLALHSFGSVSLRELAAGLFTTEAALAQRLSRARALLVEHGVTTELPGGVELAGRRAAVLAALHLLFNEGYQSAGGAVYQREELCAEALRLARGLAEHAQLGDGDSDALVALMLLQSARLPARAAGGGLALLLHEQDRGAWDGRLISLGLRYLDRSRRATALSRYHLEAQIAAAHATAPTLAATPWGEILGAYRLLARIDASPGVIVGHAIATAEQHGASEGLAILEAAPDSAMLRRYPFLAAARAELLARLGRHDEALAACDAALAAARSPAERAQLERRRAALVISHAAGDGGHALH